VRVAGPVPWSGTRFRKRLANCVCHTTSAFSSDDVFGSSDCEDGIARE
jgi:hypothetical protein